MANHDSCELGVGGWIYASSIASKGSLRTENNEGRIYTAEREEKTLLHNHTLAGTCRWHMNPELIIIVCFELFFLFFGEGEKG